MSSPSAREFQTPISSSRAPSPSLILGNTGLLINLLRNWLSPFLFGELGGQGKSASFSFSNYFLLLRGITPKLLRQHFLLTLILRVSDPWALSNSWRRLTLVGALTTICNLKAFRQKQIQLHSYRCRDKQKNRTIRIITIKIVFHHGKLVVVAAAAAIKSLQSCPTLYNPTDGSPLGSSVPKIL